MARCSSNVNLDSNNIINQDSCVNNELANIEDNDNMPFKKITY